MSANPMRCGGRATVSRQARLIPLLLTQLSTTIQVWIERSRQRRQLGELADRKDHLLADIGRSVEEARREAAKVSGFPWRKGEVYLPVCTAARTPDARPQVMNAPVRVAEHPAKSASRRWFPTTSSRCVKSTRSSNMRYLVAFVFHLPRTLNGTSPHGYRVVDPKPIDSASRRSPSLARMGILMFLLSTVFMGAASRAEDDSSKRAMFVFVCLHGSVKSQIATAHFNRIAREHSLPVIAVSRGIAVD